MNELKDHPNLYLRQHGTNPIHWKEWDKKTWENAQVQNRLVIISIGYSSCHWCHVMEKECFEDAEVALFANAHFISIKVDRESRPDIDQMYMNALHLMGKPGGWPLNCICLPDGTPIFGGTYFPKKKWLQILDELNNLFLERRDTLDGFAVEMRQALNQFNPSHQGKSLAELDHDHIQSRIADLDFEWGGTTGYPKFPMPPLINAVFHYGIQYQHKAAMRWCKITLEKIKYGGIHDLIEGGISRYSVDHRWHVPHFEKMLFDNALLMSVYAQAALRFPEEDFDEVIMGIQQWINQEMKQPSGLLSSTMDADSDGEEGKYYVFTTQEIDQILEEDKEKWDNIFDFKHHSYWENNKIVFSAKIPFSLKDEQWSTTRNRLKKIRWTKAKPVTDHKVITSWNAQMVVAYCHGSEIFPDWIEHAAALYLSMSKNLKKNGNWIQGLEGTRAITPLLFDTLAWLQKACVELFLKTTNWEYIQEALSIFYLAKPYQTDSSLYMLNAQNDWIGQITEIQDNVIPSSNAIWAENMYWLSIITGDLSFHDQGLKMMQCIGQDLNQISYHAHWNYVLQLISSGAGIVVACQPEEGWRTRTNWIHKTIVLKENVKNSFLQDKWQPKTQYSLCTLASCYPPVTHFTDIV